MDVTYLGSGSSVLAVAGQCNQGGNIVIWDTQRPLKSGPVARLSHHLAAVTALQVVLRHILFSRTTTPNVPTEASPASYTGLLPRCCV